MSASQEKKTRAQRENEEQQEARKFRRNAIIIAVVLVVVVIAALLINSNLFYRNLTAVSVGGTNYSAAELNVFYRTTFNQIYTNLGDYASYFVDTSTPLSQQQYSEGQTWADYVYEQTLQNMQQVTALYDAAGGAATAEQRAQVDEQVSTMSAYVALSGYSGLDQYLVGVFGRGVNEKVYRGVIERMIVAQDYAAGVADSYTFTTEELDAWYDEHADTYDYFTYYDYLVSSSNAAFDSIEDDEAKLAAAHEAAERIIDSDGGDTFADAVRQFDADANPTEQRTVGSSLSYYDYGEWLLDGSRKAGDSTVIDTDSGAYAVRYTGRDNNDYPLAAMRHILINAEADEDGNYSDEAKVASLMRIEELKAEWNSDPTEEHFAELANQYSDDPGNINSDYSQNGGLYEDILKGQMVSEINDFLFAEGRQPGDVGIAYSGDDAGYCGYHLVYYVGADEDTYRHEIASSTLRNEAYEANVDNLTASYYVNTGSGLRFASLA